MKYIKIVFVVLAIIVGMLHITGVWENMPIMFSLISILSIFNATHSYKDNRKTEAAISFAAAIFSGLVAIYMLLS